MDKKMSGSSLAQPNQPLECWHILDSLWPEDAASIDRRNQLKSLGCKVHTQDCFSIGSANLPPIGRQPSVFVLSNLNWRERQANLAFKYGFRDFTLGAYLQILCRFLHARASDSTIVVLARKTDLVIESMLDLGMPMCVQPLCISHSHRPIVSTAAASADAPVREIGPGEQVVGLMFGIPAYDLSFEFFDEFGFKLDAFLASRQCQVWFLGEGDARLALRCARYKQAQPEKELHTNKEERASLVTKTKNVTKKQRISNTFTDVLKRMQESDRFELTDACDYAFVATLISGAVDSASWSAKCLNCLRYSAPEDSRYCCRTCRNKHLGSVGAPSLCDDDDDDSHGPVCNHRHWFCGEVHGAGK